MPMQRRENDTDLEIFEYVLPGFDANTDVTDNKVRWVAAKTQAAADIYALPQRWTPCGATGMFIDHNEAASYFARTGVDAIIFD